jgi:hypothetical protein
VVDKPRRRGNQSNPNHLGSGPTGAKSRYRQLPRLGRRRAERAHKLGDLTTPLYARGLQPLDQPAQQALRRGVVGELDLELTEPGPRPASHA